MTPSAPELLSLADIAQKLGLTIPSVRTYHTDATRRRRQGNPLPQDMPAPDARIGRTPAWTPETVEAWRIARDEAAQRNIDRLRAPRKPRTSADES